MNDVYPQDPKQKDAWDVDLVDALPPGRIEKSIIVGPFLTLVHGMTSLISIDNLFRERIWPHIMHKTETFL